MKASILAFGWMVLLVNTAAARPDEDRLKLLSRGVNLSHWFAQSTSQYNADRIASFVSDEEIKRIRAAGFLHVRVGVEPAITGDDSIMILLESKIEKLMASDLAVVVDLHPVGDYKEKYRTDTGRAELIRTWESLIAKLVKFDPGRLFIEVMNEPFPIEGTEWQKLQSDAVQAIRRKAPKHTIVVNSGGWSGIDDIVAMTPLDDPNIVYTAHWYGPLLFTHQAADWTWEIDRKSVV